MLGHQWLIFSLFITISVALLVKDNYKPVVIKGSQLKEFIGVSIPSIIGYKYDDGHWIQIPLQIDEKHWQDWATIKKEDCR